MVGEDLNSSFRKFKIWMVFFFRYFLEGLKNRLYLNM